jgi:hypothetical protein
MFKGLIGLSLGASLAISSSAFGAGPYVTLRDDGTVAKKNFQTFDDLLAVEKKVLSLYDATGTKRPDVLSVWTDFPVDGTILETLFCPNANDAQGIGLDLSRSTEPPLRAMLLHNDVTHLAVRAKAQNAPADGFGTYLFLLELSHLWGPAIGPAELTGFLDHWSFWMDAGGSPAGGNRWKDNGDGTFSVVPQDIRALTYSMLDLYLMGLADPGEVLPFGVLENAVPPAGVFDPFSHKAYGATSFPWFGNTPFTVTATRRTITIDDVIAANGARVPSRASAPKAWTLGIVLLVGSGDSDDAVHRAQATFDPLSAALAPAFGYATSGRGTLDVLTAPPPDESDGGDDAGPSAPDTGANADAGGAPAEAPGATQGGAVGGCATTRRPVGGGWLAPLVFATLALSRRRSCLIAS